MNIWFAISLILAVVAAYLLVIEIFSVAFKLTGLATSKIRFQVASLFTGTGYTTAESELVVNDKRRRKIATACAYTGHIFSVVIMGLVINVFFSIGASISSERVTPTFTEWYFIMFYISSGIFLLVLLTKIPPINKRFQKFLESIAINSHKHNKNIVTVLDMYGKFAISEVLLNIIPDFAKEKSLYEMGLNKRYSINVLSIKRGKRVLEATKDTMFTKGDTLVMYGLLSDINEAFINSVEKGESTIIIDRTNDISLINNYGGNAFVEVLVVEVPEELKDKKIKDVGLNDKYKITIGVVKRGDEYLPPNKDMVIQKGDVVTLFGPYKNIKLMFKNDDKD